MLNVIHSSLICINNCYQIISLIQQSFRNYILEDRFRCSSQLDHFLKQIDSIRNFLIEFSLGTAENTK